MSSDIFVSVDKYDKLFKQFQSLKARYEVLKELYELRCLLDNKQNDKLAILKSIARHYKKLYKRVSHAR